MWTLLFANALADDPVTAAAALPAELLVDCKVPAEIVLDDVKLGVLHWPGQARFVTTAGPHQLRVYVGGNGTLLPFEAAPGQVVTVLAGRTGVTVDGQTNDAPPPSGTAEIALRVVGIPTAQIRIDDQRSTVTAGTDLALTLTAGPHKLSVRSADGTAIWTSGILEVHGAAVVQVSEGRMPEVSGAAVFHAGT